MDETKIIEFVEKFSAKIAEAGGQGFEYLAQYNATQAYTNIIMFSIVFIFSFCLFTYGLKKAMNDTTLSSNNDCMPPYAIPLIIGGVFLLIMFIIGSAGLSDWVATVQNPEGSVIKDILRRL